MCHRERRKGKSPGKTCQREWKKGGGRVNVSDGGEVMEEARRVVV